jgi:hypothetical protein
LPVIATRSSALFACGVLVSFFTVMAAPISTSPQGAWTVSFSAYIHAVGSTD